MNVAGRKRYCSTKVLWRKENPLSGVLSKR